MFEIGNDWAFKFSRSARATLDSKGKITVPIKPIEPDVIFTKPIIGVYVSSDSASKKWYAAGDLLQAYIVPFGSAGYAQGSIQRCVLWRHHIFNFNELPYTTESRYLISFDPRRYIKDISITVWEYQGTNQPTSNEELLNAINATHQTVRRDLTATNQSLAILKKIQQKQNL